MRLTIEKLAFGYPGKRVGQDASFPLADGEVVCLLGPNGSGKTTLFKTILGLLPPQGGGVCVDGEDIAGWSRRRLARFMGYVPQAHTAYFPFTVIEIALMGRSPHLPLFASPSKHDTRIAQGALEILGISHLADAIYTRISGGERQLALIARALAQEPQIMVMDEPTASLDFGNQMLVLDQIKRLAASGIGIILSTHDPDHAFLCADRVAMLHDGRLFRVGAPAETITSESLKRLYDVEVSVVELPGCRGSDGRPVHVCVPSQTTSH